LAVLAAKQLGAERIIAMSRHESRQRLAREFGASEIVSERGEEGAARMPVSASHADKARAALNKVLCRTS
ncbi:MAG TPA: hypothetical protein VKA82_19490, partial [Rubrobacter sp.]|nr:hypothetical protein [Rubrobacter sp.]